LRYSHQPGFTTGGLFRTDTPTINIGVGNLLGMTYDNTSASNEPVFRINGVVVATEAVPSPTGTADSDAGSDLLIGNRENGQRTFDGHFGELLFYDRILTATEIASLEAYLSGKWGVALV